MNDNRFDISASTLRELGSTEIDAVGGAENASWTLTTTITTTTLTTSPVCSATTTTTTTTVTTTIAVVEQPQ